jgi:hypothetical protein
MGFGAVESKYLPALLWTYQTFVGSREDKAKLGCGPGEQSWAAERYPYSAVYSFLNWPIGVAPANPAQVLPLTVVDHIHGYFMARNRWQDGDDIIVTHWLEYGPKGYYSSQDLKGDMRAGMVRVWGFGLRTAMSTAITGGPVTHYAQARDGSFTFTRGSGTGAAALAVDFSRTSGAEAAVVAVGPGAVGASKRPAVKNEKASTQALQLKLGAAPVNVLTLQTGAPPKVSVEGEALMIGAQRFAWDGAKLTPVVFKE